MQDQADASATVKGIVATADVSPRLPDPAIQRRFEYATAVCKNALKPVFDALAALPEKDGEKFHVHEFAAWPGGNPQISIGYYNEADHDEYLDILQVAVKAVDHKKFWSSDTETTAQFNITMGAKQKSTAASLEDAGKAIGKWLNRAARDRTGEAKAALQLLNPKA